jgi:hypothetical protein
MRFAISSRTSLQIENLRSYTRRHCRSIIFVLMARKTAPRCAFCFRTDVHDRDLPRAKYSLSV